MTRVLFWVQHLLGSGHLGRARTLAAALAREGLHVTLVNGGRPLPWLGGERVQTVDLPSISASDASFGLIDAHGRPVGAAWWASRRRQLLDLLDTLRPAAVVTEMFPFGRRAFRDEVLAILEWARARGALRIASVRDVLVEGSAEKHRWMRDVALEHYDLLLAHTDPELIPFGLTFPHRGELGARLVETGFVAPQPAPAGSTGCGEVIVSAGGGRVGQTLLRTALKARRLARSPATWRLIAPDEAAARALERHAGAGVVVDRQRPDFRDLLANGLLSVSQAGYNTVVEALACEKRMVLVPFERAGETEQRTRAAQLAARGLATVVAERDLTAEALARAVEATLESATGGRPRIDLDGARRSAQLIASRLGAKP